MSELHHKDRTIQDVIDEMTPEQRDLMDYIVGAAVADEVIDDDAVVAQAEALSLEQRQAIDFIVGGLLFQSIDGELSQDALRVSEFLEHFGVKGMKWGVRKRDETGGSSAGGGSSASKSQQKPTKPPKLVGNASTVKLSGSTSNTKDERAAARKAVRRGTADATQAHVAALKSTGHRVANAFLGDKTYWKGVAITAGVAGSVALSPAVLPVGVLGAIGAGVTGAASGSAVAVAAGSTAITTSAYVGAQVASAVLQVKNLYRAVAGNSKVDESYARMGATTIENYRLGVNRTAKTLRRNGGLSGRKTKKALKQSDDLRVDNFLEHHLGMTLGHMQSEA